MKAAIERLQTLSTGDIESVVSPQLTIVKVRKFIRLWVKVNLVSHLSLAVHAGPP